MCEKGIRKRHSVIRRACVFLYRVFTLIRYTLVMLGGVQIHAGYDKQRGGQREIASGETKNNLLYIFEQQLKPTCVYMSVKAPCECVFFS